MKYLVKERPFRIDFDFGENRLSITDKDGDGKYELKETQRKPSYIDIRNDADIASSGYRGDYDSIH